MAYRIIEVVEVVEQRGAEPRRIFGGLAGIAGLLIGMFPQFAHSGLAVLLAIGLVLMAILALIGDWFDGASLRVGALRLVLLGGLAFAATYLPMWLTIYYLPQHPEYYDLLMPKFS